MPGMMQSITQAAGEALTQFCGAQMTRLTVQAFVGDSDLQCERTVGFADVGQVQVDGVVYQYASRTDFALGGLSCETLTGAVYGVQEAHALGAPVVDASRTTSFLDLTRRSIFVDTADGEDLNVIGRNLGVPRDPAVVDDDHYRAIIKAIAYNPRGTRYGLETALDAMVGPGNYKLVEDLENYPCSIELILPAGLFLSSTAEGHTYLDGKTLSYAQSAAALTLLGSLTDVTSVQLADEQFYIDCRAALPDAAMLPTPLGQQSAFALQGASGAAALVQLGPGAYATQITKGQSYYTHVGNFGPHSAVQASMVLTIPQNATLAASDARGFAVRIIDGAYAYGFGCTQSAPASFSIGLCNPTASGQGAYVTGAAITLPKGSVVTVRLDKSLAGALSLYVDGRLVQSADITAFPSAQGQAPAFDWGSLGSQAGLGTVRFVGLHTHSPGEAMSTVAERQASVAGTTLTDNKASFTGAEQGQPIRISGGTAKNSLGGTNNGLFVAQYVSATQLGIVGIAHVSGASVSQGNARVRISATEPAFTYPDDLGRSLTLSGSASGNDGSYTITGIIQDGTGLSFGRFATPVRGRGSTCVVQATSFVAETGLDWCITPSFVAEASLNYEVNNTASVRLSDAGATIAPAQPFAYAHAIYAAQARTMRSGQVLDTHLPVVTQTSAGPPILYSYAPAYVSEPDNFVFGYVQSLLAAGITLRNNYD